MPPKKIYFLSFFVILVLGSFCLPLEIFAKNSHDLPKVIVKRPSGKTGISQGIIFDMQKPDYEPDYYMWLRRNLGKQINQVTIKPVSIVSEQKIEKSSFVSNYVSLKNKKDLGIAHYFLNKGRIVGYILDDLYFNTFYHKGFVKEILDNGYTDCSEYLSENVKNKTQKFLCSTFEHENYIEKYVFEIQNLEHQHLRTLIVDSFYPKQMKNIAEKEIREIINRTALEFRKNN